MCFHAKVLFCRFCFFMYSFPQCKSTLLVFCQSGHVVEVQPPESEAQNAATTFHLSGLPTRTFYFRSIKSRIKVEQAFLLV